MKSRHTIILTAAGLFAAYLAPTAKGEILFQVADLGGGNSQWQLVSSSTTYTVGTYNPTGNLDEGILLPKGAFTFDYSQPFFSFTFSNPIGAIKDLTSGQSVPLNQIVYYQHLDQLELTGGLMGHTLGDQFQITDFSTADIAIPFSDLVGNIIGDGYFYGTPGAFHNDNAIGIIPVAAPEPSSLVLFGFGITGLLFSRKLRLSQKQILLNYDDHVA